MMKEHYAHLALLGVGAVIVLWWLMRQSSAPAAAAADESPAAGAAPVAASAFAAYPNTPQIQPSNFEVGGSPISITYNMLPPGALQDSTGFQLQPPAGADCSCGGSGGGGGCGGSGGENDWTPVTISKVPAPVFNKASENFGGYAVKALGGARSGGGSSAAPAPRVTFSA